MSLIDNLSIGLKSLLTQQKALEVTGHNIANVNTPGYSKQIPILTNADPVMIGNFFLGTGVELSEIHQVRDRFLDYSIRNETQTKEGYYAQQRIASLVEGIFAETDDTGLNKAITTYFNSFHELSVNPENAALRNNVISAAEDMVNMFHARDENLFETQKRVDTDISSYISRVNTLTEQIAKLNGQIVTAAGSNINPNDLVDQRTVLVEQVSELLNVNAYETDNGSLTVTTISGKALVVGSEWFEMKAIKDPSNNNYSNVFIENRGNLQDVTGDITEGRIGGGLEIRDNFIAQLRNDLDNLAYNIVNEVNSLHQTGYGLDGSTGNTFFDPLTGPTSKAAAKNIDINPALFSDVNLIAAAGTNNPGDNQIAVSIAEIQNALVMNSGKTSINDFYAGMINRIGNKTRNINEMLQVQEDLLVFLENQRNQISGVSLDEEAVNLLKFQRAYQACARFIETVDKMSDELLQRM